MSDEKATGEPSGASGGSLANEPVAWAVTDDRGLQLALHPTPGHAASMARNFGNGVTEVVPLYRLTWIPVDERWPEHLSDVLVVYKCGKYVRLGVGEFDGTTVNDEGMTIPYFKGIGGFEVTHWMPLPAPPTDAK